MNWSRTFAGFVLLKAVTDDAALGRLRNFFRALYPFFRFATRFCLLPHLTVLYIFFILFIMTYFILWLIIYCRVSFLPVPLLQLATFFAFAPRSVDTVSNFLDMLTLFRIIGNFCRPFTFHTSLFFISLLSVPWKWSLCVQSCGFCSAQADGYSWRCVNLLPVPLLQLAPFCICSPFRWYS